jgi:hypothetical protein
MKPNFRNLFMKKLTRDRVVPIISASVSWLIFAVLANAPAPVNLGEKRFRIE